MPPPPDSSSRGHKKITPPPLQVKFDQYSLLTIPKTQATIHLTNQLAMVKIQCISIWYIHVDFKQIGQQSNNYDKIVYRIFYLHPYQCDKVCQ